MQTESISNYILFEFITIAVIHTPVGEKYSVRKRPSEGHLIANNDLAKVRGFLAIG